MSALTGKIQDRPNLSAGRSPEAARRFTVSTSQSSSAAASSALSTSFMPCPTGSRWEESSTSGHRCKSAFPTRLRYLLALAHLPVIALKMAFKLAYRIRRADLNPAHASISLRWAQLFQWVNSLGRFDTQTRDLEYVAVPTFVVAAKALDKDDFLDL